MTDNPDYKPGDIVNGYQLNEDGTAWLPLQDIPIETPEPAPKRAKAGLSTTALIIMGTIVGVALLSLAVSLSSGKDSTANPVASQSAPTPSASAPPTELTATLVWNNNFTNAQRVAVCAEEESGRAELFNSYVPTGTDDFTASEVAVVTDYACKPTTATQAWAGFDADEKSAICAEQGSDRVDKFNETTPPETVVFTAADVEPVTDSACPKPKPKPKPKPVVYEEISDRQFAKIVRNPDGHIGDTITIYGEVTQYDSATGLSSMLANTSNDPQGNNYYLYGENSYLSGDSSDLEELVEDDTFKAKVKVTGAFSYDTQAGGNTSVPEFEVVSITRTGSN